MRAFISAIMRRRDASCGSVFDASGLRIMVQPEVIPTRTILRHAKVNSLMSASLPAENSSELARRNCKCTTQTKRLHECSFRSRRIDPLTESEETLLLKIDFGGSKARNTSR